MIRFKCDSCGRGFRVPESHAGKKGRCPKCSTIVRIPRCAPETQENGASLGMSTWRDGDLHLKQETLAPTPSPELPDWSTQRVEDTLPNDDTEEKPGVRKYPWPIDILLYPANTPGLINLLMFWFLLPLITGILSLFAGFIPLLGFIIALILSLLVPAYIIYYLAQCIRDSALGGTRAPENMNDNPNPWGALGHLFEIIAVVVVVLAPAFFTYLHFREMNCYFWICIGVGSFVLPMALLAVIIFESITGFNPFRWIMAIFSTLIPYLGLVAIFASLAVGSLLYMQWTQDFLMSNIFLRGPLIYTAMTLAHVLGRFYYRFQNRLGW